MLKMSVGKIRGRKIKIKSHPETRVWYKDGSYAEFNIVGEIYGDNVQFVATQQIDNVYDAIKVDLGSTITSIGPSTFDTCVDLQEVIIPDTVRNIEIDAFYDCDSLTSVYLPDSIIHFGTDVSLLR